MLNGTGNPPPRASRLHGVGKSRFTVEREGCEQGRERRERKALLQELMTHLFSERVWVCKRCQERGVAHDVGVRRMMHVSAAPAVGVDAGEGGSGESLVLQRGSLQET